MSETLTEHAPTECACPACQPERFAGREASASQPVHACQRCFAGVCMTPATGSDETEMVEAHAE